jgi:hypothetical protein
MMSMSSSWMPMETSNGPKPSAEKLSDVGFSLIQTSEGGYAIAGFTTSFGVGEADVYVVKLNAHGNLQWTKTIGAKNEDLIKSSIIQTSDGSYVIASTTRSFSAGKRDVYVVKLDKNGDACCAVSETSQVGSGGRLRSATSLHKQRRHPHRPHPHTSSGGTLTNQCP